MFSLQRIFIIFSVVLFTLLGIVLYNTAFRSTSVLLYPSSNPSPVKSILKSVDPSPTSPPVVQIGLVGDLGLGRNITSIARKKNDFSWPFQKISPWLQENDFNVANLESPIISDCPEGKTGTFTFCGDQRFLPYLVQNRFVFSLANNHILNYGQKGYDQTKDFLSQNHLGFYDSQFESDPIYFKTVDGIKFGFLSFDFITYPEFDQQKVINLVKKYDSEVDWLIVSLHWGNEYKPSAETWRIKFAHELVDAGADIIHGQHPHVWQPEETYKGKIIYYSLGNFIFDQSWSYETSHTNIIRLTLSKDKIQKTQSFPVEIKYNSQPWL